MEKKISYAEFIHYLKSDPFQDYFLKLFDTIEEYSSKHHTLPCHVYRDEITSVRFCYLLDHSNPLVVGDEYLPHIIILSGSAVIFDLFIKNKVAILNVDKVYQDQFSIDLIDWGLNAMLEDAFYPNKIDTSLNLDFKEMLSNYLENYNIIFNYF
jgi:hypothetical protein